MRNLAEAIRLRMDEERLPLDDMAMFLDWCSIFQKARTDAEDVICKCSLRAVNVQYAHACIMVWLLTQVPHDVIAYKPAWVAHL